MIADWTWTGVTSLPLDWRELAGPKEKNTRFVFQDPQPEGDGIIYYWKPEGGYEFFVLLANGDLFPIRKAATPAFYSFYCWAFEKMIDEYSS